VPPPRATRDAPDRPAARAESDVLSALVRLVTERAARLRDATAGAPAGDALREAVDALGHYLDALDLVRAAGISIEEPGAEAVEEPRPDTIAGPRAERDEPPLSGAMPSPVEPRSGGEPTVAAPPAPGPRSSPAAGIEREATGPPLAHADGGSSPAQPGAAQHRAPGDTGEGPAPGTIEGPASDGANGGRGTASGARPAEAAAPETRPDSEPAQPERRYPAFRDGVTGLLSREGFEWIASGELKRCARHGRVFTILLLQLCPVDPDTLPRTAEVVRRALRGSDVAGREGERAVVVALPETAQREARAVGERLIAELEGAGVWRREGRIGMAAYPTHGETVWSLLETARGKLSLPVGNVLQRGGDGGYWSG